jgi:hypothetical protein
VGNLPLPHGNGLEPDRIAEVFPEQQPQQLRQAEIVADKLTNHTPAEVVEMLSTDGRNRFGRSGQSALRSLA